MRRFAHLADLAACVGQEFAASGWHVVDQACIDAFAQATGDFQWIHVDPVRAAASPFGTTIAHGFLTLSLLPRLSYEAFAFDDVRYGLNYGLDRVRFPAPLPAGSRVRATFRLTSYAPIEGGAQFIVEATMRREGHDKPVCVAEQLIRQYTQEPKGGGPR